MHLQWRGNGEGGNEGSRPPTFLQGQFCKSNKNLNNK